MMVREISQRRLTRRHVRRRGLAAHLIQLVYLAGGEGAVVDADAVDRMLM
jgi:hypothetical protein